MKPAIALLVLALLVLTIGCATQVPDSSEQTTEDPFVDSFDDGFESTEAQEDMDDLESLDSDLAAFE